MKKLLLKLLGKGASFFISYGKTILIVAAAAVLVKVSYEYGKNRVQVRFDQYVAAQVKEAQRQQKEYETKLQQAQQESDQRYSQLQNANAKNDHLTYRINHLNSVCNESAAKGANQLPDSSTAPNVGKTGSTARSYERFQQDIRNLRTAIETQREALRMCVSQYQKYAQ